MIQRTLIAYSWLWGIGVLAFSCSQPPSASHQSSIEKNMLYLEKHRPQFHFSPQTHWMNDPNGMFYYQGKYHLFYQYYPDGIVWGPMHWGHAVSKDLMHWEELPIALYPDELGYIFSGGAVVDHANSSGLGSGETPPIIATFTHHDPEGEKAKALDYQYQSIAYSLDGGSSWEKYAGNPVLPNTEKFKDFRDPKVIWHESSQRWIMTLAVYDRVQLFTSPNLIDWQYLSDFGIEGDKRLWECPDLFPMKVAGTEEEKWVLIVSIQQQAPNGGSATSYFVGDFDGTHFTADKSQQQWLDWGPDNYAFVTWNNVPQSKQGERYLGIGWMSNWQYAQGVPTEKWRSAMTVVRELELTKTAEGYLLLNRPVAELAALRKKSYLQKGLVVKGEKILSEVTNPLRSELQLTIDLEATTAKRYGLKLENELGEYLSVALNPESGNLEVDRTHSRQDKFEENFFKQVHTAPIDFQQRSIELQILIDAASIEIFVDGGAMVYSGIFFPTKDYQSLSLFAEAGTWSLDKFACFDLASIWEKESNPAHKN